MKCPRCGGCSFKYEVRSAGTAARAYYYRTGVKSDWFIPSGYKTYKSKRKHKTIAVCKNCGYSFNTASQDAGAAWFYVLCVIFFPITLSVLFFRTKRIEMKKIYRLLIIVAFWTLVYTGDYVWSKHHPYTTDPAAVSTNSVWADQITPLSEFEYDADGEDIYLKRYTGNEDAVYIAPSYDIGDKECHVVGIDDAFIYKPIKSIIIPESVTYIKDNTFNGSDVEFIYIPRSLTQFDGWNYFHGVKNLYYGGNKSEWGKLFTRDPSNLDVVSVIYNASISDIISDK